MGAKFYRGSDKPKKIRKRLSQTRSWFGQFKWVACKSIFFYTLSQCLALRRVSSSSYRLFCP